VEEGLGYRTLSFRRASKITGIGLSALHRHITRHWTPPIEERVQPAVGRAPVPSEAPKPGRPYSSPCVIQLVDQMAIARLHAKKWPPAYDLAEAFARVVRPLPKPPAPDLCGGVPTSGVSDEDLDVDI
jgi:hypothetical protein